MWIASPSREPRSVSASFPLILQTIIIAPMMSTAGAQQPGSEQIIVTPQNKRLKYSTSHDTGKLEPLLNQEFRFKHLT